MVRNGVNRTTSVAAEVDPIEACLSFDEAFEMCLRSP